MAVGDEFLDALRERINIEAARKPALFTDIYGRSEKMWDFDLPHSKCDCGECAQWREKNWRKLNPEWVA